MFNKIYKDLNVFLTGHTGFKGSWFCAWLEKLGAHVTGYALVPPTQPNHYDLLGLSVDSIISDIRDQQALEKAISSCRPDIVFHFAAQPLVRRSYRAPIETLETNVMGTTYLLEACRATQSVKALVNITSDKCYESGERLWGYREVDPLGGHDPYSCSKACSEIVTASYRQSFGGNFGSGGAGLISSVRAGNVIGGGDWAEDRLVPDLVRSAQRGEAVAIRYPEAVRPWQHVLEPLSGYLLLGQRLLEGRSEFACAWNFGPDADGLMSVGQLVDAVSAQWPAVRHKTVTGGTSQPYEASYLFLDTMKARQKLGWKPVWSPAEGIAKTVDWYRLYSEQGRVITEDQIDAYVRAAVDGGMVWAEETA